MNRSQYSEMLPLSDSSADDLAVPLSIARVEPRRDVNVTAYRIFKLLQWLMQEPMSVEEINRRFCAEPLLGRAVSNDSIWLYINTLKALGCHIRRPSPRNQFQYELLSHPFSYQLSATHLEMLARAKAYAQTHFSHQDMLLLDAFVRKVVMQSACPDAAKVLEEVFERSRSVDYQAMAEQIARLETWIHAVQLLNVTYVSPFRGKASFFFLPQAIYQELGVVYVRGERSDCQGPSSLRVDRVLSAVPVRDPALVEGLLVRQMQTTEAVVHIFAEHSDCLPSLDLTENQGVRSWTSQWVAGQAGEAAGYYECRFQVRDYFYLQQRLLACGLPVRVLAPQVFREAFTGVVRKMLGYYNHSGDNGGE